MSLSNLLLFTSSSLEVCINVAAFEKCFSHLTTFESES